MKESQKVKEEVEKPLVITLKKEEKPKDVKPIKKEGKKSLTMKEFIKNGGFK